MKQHKMLDGCFLFQETHLDGSIKSEKNIELMYIHGFLLHECNLPEDQVNNAIKITLDNPGQPYDVHLTDDRGAIVWASRITYKQRTQYNLGAKR